MSPGGRPVPDGPAGSCRRADQPSSALTGRGLGMAEALRAEDGHCGWLAEGIHAVRVGDDLVLLDLAADDYLCLPECGDLRIEGRRALGSIDDLPAGGQRHRSRLQRRHRRPDRGDRRLGLADGAGRRRGLLSDAQPADRAGRDLGAARSRAIGGPASPRRRFSWWASMT